MPWLGLYVLNETGEPVPERDLLKWATWYETAQRHVALTEFAWGRVSTIFLGLDHNFLLRAEDDPLHYKPILWETMVFRGTLTGEQRRYRSREEALKGHRTMVERAKAAEKNSEDRICLENKAQLIVPNR